MRDDDLAQIFVCPCGKYGYRDTGGSINCDCGRRFVAVVGGDYVEVKAKSEPS